MICARWFRRFTGAFLILFAIYAVPAAQAKERPVHTGACDRACLVRAADSFLAALARRDAPRLRVAKALRVTLNVRDVTLGQALAQGVEAVPSRQVFADPDNGQVVTFGTVRRGGQIEALMLRLKVVGGRISEIEMLRGGDSDGPYSFARNLLHPDVLYDAPVPGPRQSSRRELVQVADAYFTALERHDGSLAAFSERCDRYESGARVTNNTGMIGAPDGGVFTCAQSLEAAKATAVAVSERRFPVVDMPRGLVVVIDFLEPMGPSGPKLTLYLAAVFKIVDGGIRGLDEINVEAPLGSRTRFKP